VIDPSALVPPSPPPAAELGVLATGLLLGVRHGIDWDHIAAITDITSTTAAAGMGDAAHAGQHLTDRARPRPRRRPGAARARRRARCATAAPALAARPPIGGRRHPVRPGEAIRLGTLYALGHGAVVIALGIAAIAFGALLPTGSTRSWAGSSADPRLLGLWVMYSIYRYARAGERFRLRSRWMLVVRRDPLRLAPPPGRDPRPRARRAARDELVRRATSFGVGMIHGIGAETGTQVLLIAAVGGASAAGLGIPMLFAFVVGLLISNFAIVVLSSVSFVSSQAREQIYVAIGAVAGLFSLFVGTIFLFGLEGALPDLGGILPF
jgi:high-affinity nickel-transport protein